MKRLSRMSRHLSVPSHDVAALPTTTAPAAAGRDNDDIFDMTAPCVRGFSRSKFEADGFWVWDGLMLPHCREQLTAALQRVQRLQDELVMDETRSRLKAADYATLGLTPPTRFYSKAERQEMLGSSQATGALAAGIEPTDEAERQATLTPHPRTGAHDVTLMPESKYRQRMPLGSWGGVLPEHFPSGYDERVLRMVTHPQMLALHRLMLGEDLRYDHVVALNRRGGFDGQGWHSHGYAEDNQVPTTRLPALGLVRSLAYPEGFSARNDGGIKVVRGSALHRSSDVRFADDRTLRDEWMEPRRNPATGERLEIWAEALPPGSMVSIACHTVHGVSPRLPRGDAQRDGYLHKDSTRWCCLFSYRSPDPAMLVPPSSRGVPEPFRLAVSRGEVAACDTEEKRQLFEPF